MRSAMAAASAPLASRHIGGGAYQGPELAKLRSLPRAGGVAAAPTLRKAFLAQSLRAHLDMIRPPRETRSDERARRAGQDERSKPDDQDAGDGPPAPGGGHHGAAGGRHRERRQRAAPARLGGGGSHPQEGRALDPG